MHACVPPSLSPLSLRRFVHVKEIIIYCFTRSVLLMFPIVVADAGDDNDHLKGGCGGIHSVGVESDFNVFEMFVIMTSASITYIEVSVDRSCSLPGFIKHVLSGLSDVNMFCLFDCIAVYR